MSNCVQSDDDFNELCQNEIKESLHQLPYAESIVLILNSELLMMNAVPKRVIKRVAESKICFQIMTNTDWRAHGVNILGSKEAVLRSLHSIKNYVTLDTERFYFDNVDEWKENAIGVDNSFNINSVRDLTQRDTPLVLMQANDNRHRNKYDHFVNLMQKNVLEQLPSTPSTQEMTSTVFVCLTILPDFDGQTLFLEEFLQGFLKQDYPQNLMDVLILSPTSMPEQLLSKTSHYRSQCLKITEKGLPTIQFNRFWNLDSLFLISFVDFEQIFCLSFL